MSNALHVQEIVNAVGQKIHKETKGGARIDHVFGAVVAIDEEAHLCDLYVDGNDTASEDFRIPLGMTVRIGDTVRAGIDYGSNLGKWVEEVLPYGTTDNTGTPASSCGRAVALLPSGVDSELSLAFGGGGNIFVHDGAKIVKYKSDLTQIYNKAAAGGVPYLSDQFDTTTPVVLGDRAYRRDTGAVAWDRTGSITAVAARSQDRPKYWVSVGSTSFEDYAPDVEAGDPYMTKGNFDPYFGPLAATTVTKVWQGYVTTSGTLSIKSDVGGEIYYAGGAAAGTWEYAVLRWLTYTDWNDPDNPPSVSAIASKINTSASPSTQGQVIRQGHNGVQAAGWLSYPAFDVKDPKGTGVEFSTAPNDIDAGQWVMLVLANDHANPGSGTHQITSVAPGLRGDNFVIYGTAVVADPDGTVVDSTELQVRNESDGSLVSAIAGTAEYTQMRTPSSSQFVAIKSGTSEITFFDRSLAEVATFTLTDFFPTDDWAVDENKNIYRLDGDVVTKYNLSGDGIWISDLNASFGYNFPSGVISAGNGNQIMVSDLVRIVGSTPSAGDGTEALLIGLAKSDGSLKIRQRFGGGDDDDAAAGALHISTSGCLYIAGQCSGTEFESIPLSGTRGFILRVGETLIDSGPDIPEVGITGIVVKDIDGTPTSTDVDTLRFTNGHVTDDGGGQATVTIPTAHSDLTGIGADDHHARQHSITSGSDHTFPGGSTTYLRADGTFATPSGSGSLEVKEVDGSPDVTGVSIVRVTNSHLTNDGSGQVTIAIPTAHADLTSIGADDHHAKSHAHNGSDGSGTVDAVDVGITDSGSYFTSTEVESALQEVAAAVTGGSGGLGTNAIAGWCGDGSDGSYTLDGSNTPSWATRSGSVYTLTRDIFMTTLTIDSGVTLRGSTGGNGGMYRIYATGSINNAGTIQFVGNAGNASSGIGGAAFTGLNCTLRGGDGGANWRLNTVNNGVAVTANTEISGGAGGAGGGDNAGHTGGASNASFAPINGSFRTLPWVTQGWYSGGPTAQPPKRITGGGGGGGGACNGAITTNSGAGGGGGGVLVLVAPTIVNSGTITVEGGAGAVAGTGVSGGSTSAAGGGGGGGGGVIFLTYHSLTNTGTLNVSGGAGGAGVTGGAAGSNGSDGSVIQTQL